MSPNQAEEKYWINYRPVVKFTMPLHKRTYHVQCGLPVAALV